MKSYWSRQERGEDWLGESLRVVGTGFWVEVGNGQLVWGKKVTQHLRVVRGTE